MSTQNESTNNATNETSTNNTATTNKNMVDPVIASKVEQIKTLHYATSIVAEDVIERNFGYKIIRQQVSSGKNTIIYRCESVRYPDSYCLVKPYKGGKDKIKKSLREDTVQILRYVTAKCPQVISTYEIFYTNEKIYLMCDWSAKGEVLTCLKNKSVRLTEAILRDWATDLLNAVQFLHSNAICHRNIAPNCLLLTAENRVKIGVLSDAGVYCKPDGTLIRQKWTKFSRDANWNQAPEVFKQKAFDPRKADIWSIGATIYWFVCRTYPLDYRSNQKLTKQLDFRTMFLKRISRRGQAFVKKLLTYQPNLRPSLQQALEMDWIISDARSPAGSPARGAGTSQKPESRSTSQKPKSQQPSAPYGTVSTQIPPPTADLTTPPENVGTGNTTAEPGEAAAPEESGAPEQVVDTTNGGQESPQTE